MLEKFAVKYHAAFIKLTILFVFHHAHQTKFEAADAKKRQTYLNTGYDNPGGNNLNSHQIETSNKKRISPA